MPVNIGLIVFLTAGMVLSVWFKKLTVPAALTGGLCSLLVFAAAGYTGIAIMTGFFMAGTLATSHKARQKQQLKFAGADDNRRKASQVLANAGVAAIAGVMALIFKDYAMLWPLIVAASFSAAMADTLSSELGTVYGRNFYNILSLKPDQRGLDGVISLEGTLIGIAGSAFIAAIYAVGFGWNSHFIIILLAGAAGNLADSILGAALERQGIIKNDAVNFLNTLTGGMLALGIWMIG